MHAKLSAHFYFFQVNNQIEVQNWRNSQIWMNYKIEVRQSRKGLNKARRDWHNDMKIAAQGVKHATDTTDKPHSRYHDFTVAYRNRIIIWRTGHKRGLLSQI